MFNQLKDIIRRNNFIVMDTETSGVDNYAQILSIAVLDRDGQILVNTLTRPYHSGLIEEGRTIPTYVSAKLTAIHGITNEQVHAARPWPEVWNSEVAPALYDRDIIIYNSEFDLRLIRQSCRAWSITPSVIDLALTRNRVVCVMLAYAEYRAEPNSRRDGGFRWHRLSAACEYERLPVTDAHDAAADCRMTLALINQFAHADPQQSRLPGF